jgi:hypothetical protein
VETTAPAADMRLAVALAARVALELARLSRPPAVSVKIRAVSPWPAGRASAPSSVFTASSKKR